MFGVGPYGGASNPLTDYLLGLVATDSPGTVAAGASSIGLSPPQPGGADAGFGSLFNPLPGGGAAFPEGVFTGMGGAPGLNQVPLTGQPMPVPGQQMLQGLGSMAGVKAPGAVPAPIFNAGVSGAQKAPEGSPAGAGASQMMGLLKLLQGSAGPAATPARSLGSYF